MIRAWQIFDGDTTWLVVVSGNIIHIERIDAAECRRRLDLLQVGQKPACLFGTRAVAIRFDRVQCIDSRDEDGSIHFRFRAGRCSRRMWFAIPDTRLRQAMFADIHRAMSHWFLQSVAPAVQSPCSPGASGFYQGTFVEAGGCDAPCCGVATRLDGVIPVARLGDPRMPGLRNTGHHTPGRKPEHRPTAGLEECEEFNKSRSPTPDSLLRTRNRLL